MPSPHLLPHEVQVLLNECIESVSDLDILCFLFKNNAQNSKDISAELRAHPTSTERKVKRLVGFNLLVEELGAYSISPGAREKLEPLIELYQSKPVTIIAFLYERPTDLESFANAFKWKKD